MSISSLNIQLALGIVASVLAWPLQILFEKHSVPVSIVTVSLSIMLALYTSYIVYRLLILKGMGISNWERSISKGTSTLACISMSQKNVDFLGIAASKWIKESDQLRKMLVRHASNGGKTRMLVLDPTSDACAHFESIKNAPKGSIANMIFDSIRAIQKLAASGLPIEIRLYSTVPHFRITVLDNKSMFVSIYSYVSDTGEDSPQLVLDGKQRPWSYFYSFASIFERTWESSSPVDDTIKIHLVSAQEREK